MEVVVLNIKGQETGRTVSLDEAVFGIEPSTHTVYLEVKQYLAAQRQGTHKAKERAEIAGSTRKIKKQKGTGTARAVLTDLGLENTKSLFVLGESNSNVYLSSRNLQKVKVVTTEELNVFDLINASQIVFLEGSLATVQENLTK